MIPKPGDIGERTGKYIRGMWIIKERFMAGTE